MTKLDDELCYILATAHYEQGAKNVADGSMVSGEKNLEAALKYAEMTRLDTSNIESKSQMLLSITKNVQSPLLEFNANKYMATLNDACDFELFKYLTLDFDYTYTTPSYSLHIEAKKLIRERQYLKAAEVLLTAADKIKKDGYNSFIIFGIYTDLEYCYKQLYDYEKAYKYSTNRITLLEGFKA